jgi:DNA-binding response OmpR family regulator
MHMKRALLASDDVHTAARFRAAIAGLDISIAECGLMDVSSRLAEREVDLVVVDGGRSPDVLVQAVENAVAEGMAVSLLLLVDSEGLGSLRLPTRLNADFMLREGTSEEATARVRGLLWPGEEASTQELIRIDDMTLNLATYQAYRGGEPIDFTYLEYALFTFLVTHPNRAYSREVLLRRVWGSDYYGGSRTVDVHIRRIRSKIGGELNARLQTVRNVGYLWKS